MVHTYIGSNCLSFQMIFHVGLVLLPLEVQSECIAPNGNGVSNAELLTVIDADAHFVEGHMMQYRCNAGFRASQGSSRVCSNGQWTPVHCIGNPDNPESVTAHSPTEAFTMDSNTTRPQEDTSQQTTLQANDETEDNGTDMVTTTHSADEDANDEYGDYGNYEDNENAEAEDEVECKTPENGRLSMFLSQSYKCTCNDGYTLISNGGDIYYECSDGKWKSKKYGKEPKCTKTLAVQSECIAPNGNGVSNAELLNVIDADARFVEGHMLQYRCNAGFRARRGSNRFCSGGQWTPIHCIRIFCPSIHDPENGKRLNNGSFVGEKAMYECNEGYTLKGLNTLECRDDGEWRPQSPPTCEPLAVQSECIAPNGNGVSNAELVSVIDADARFVEGHMLQYRCNAGFRPRQGSKRFCADGQWTPIHCIRIFCPSIHDPENGKRLNTGSLVGKMAVYECNEGYTCKGSNTLRCRADGKWRPQRPPNCEPVRCSSIDHLNDGYTFQKSLDGKKNIYGRVVQFNCNRGFDLHGSSERRCQGNGQWSGERCVCKAPTCPDFPPFYNGKIYYPDGEGDHLIAHAVEVECHNDSTLFPDGFDGVAYCKSKDKWEYTGFTCERKARLGPKADMKLYKLSKSRMDRRERIFLAKEFESRTKLLAKCEHGYEMYDKVTKDYSNKTSLNIEINNGTIHPPLQICKEARCSLSENFRNSFSYTGNGGIELGRIVEHGTDVTKTCNGDHEFEPILARKLPSYRLTCDKGVIGTFPDCIPIKPMSLSITTHIVVEGILGKAAVCSASQYTTRNVVVWLQIDDDNITSVPDITLTHNATTETFTIVALFNLILNRDNNGQRVSCLIAHDTLHTPMIATGTIKVNSIPIILGSSPIKTFAAIQTDTLASITFYSYRRNNMVECSRNSTRFNCVCNLEDVDISLPVFDSIVQTKGWTAKVNFAIQDNNDFGTFTVTISNDVGASTIDVIILNSEAMQAEQTAIVALSFGVITSCTIIVVCGVLCKRRYTEYTQRNTSLQRINFEEPDELKKNGHEYLALMTDKPIQGENDNIEPSEFGEVEV